MTSERAAAMRAGRERYHAEQRARAVARVRAFRAWSQSAPEGDPGALREWSRAIPEVPTDSDWRAEREASSDAR